MLFLIVLPTWRSPLQLSPFIIHAMKLPTHHAFPSLGHTPFPPPGRPTCPPTSISGRVTHLSSPGPFPNTPWGPTTHGELHNVCWMNEWTDRALLQFQWEEGLVIHIFTQNPVSEHKHVYHSYPLLISLYFSPLDQVHFSLFIDYLFLFSLPETEEFLLDPWRHCQAQGSGWHTILLLLLLLSHFRRVWLCATP